MSAAGRPPAPSPAVDPWSRPSDERLGEARYGDWTGRALKDLAKEPLWKVVQAHPSAAVFPGGPDGVAGEGLAAMQARAVEAVRDWNARLGPDAVWLACSHGDVIKAILADALGLHLDQFQRISVDPCSITAIRYTELRPFVLRVNDTGGGVEGLVPPAPRKGRRRKPPSSDAAVGGGAGPAAIGLGSPVMPQVFALRPARALRGRHRRRARTADVLPAGPRRRPR